MLPDISLLIIPKAYPANMNKINIRLFPFAVLDRMDFTIETGHEIPKLITISASKS
jgi:hypothetical protein